MRHRFRLRAGQEKEMEPQMNANERKCRLKPRCAGADPGGRSAHAVYRLLAFICVHWRFNFLLRASQPAARRQGQQDLSDADRTVSPGGREEDAAEASLRPQTLAEFIGQRASRENLAIFIAAARARGEALDHVLLHGPPGLGKTTLAQIIARELGVGFRATSGPVIQRAGDLAAILTNLQPRDVLFIDEIHRLQPAIEEVLYPAMEDFQLDLIIGEGPAARSVRIDLPPFTLVGATTRAGLLATPLRDRFGIPLRLVFYTPAELELIVTRGAALLGMQLTPDGAVEIARRSRGTPRVAGRLLRRVRDFAAVAGTTPIDRAAADAALTRLEVDRRRPRRDGPALPAAHRRTPRRRAGRGRDPGGGAGRGARHAGGRDRAVPDPGGPGAAHQPRAHAGRAGLAASRPADPARASAGQLDLLRDGGPPTGPGGGDDAEWRPDGAAATPEMGDDE